MPRALLVLLLGLVLFVGDACKLVGATTQKTISVMVTPSAGQSLLRGATLRITAAVDNDNANRGVTWSLGNGSGGFLSNATASEVIYHAPFAVTAPVAETIVARSRTNQSRLAQVDVTVQPSQSLLLGQFGFQFTGFGAQGAVAIAGSFTVDQNGVITGEEDFKDPAAATLAAAPIHGTAVDATTPNAGTFTLNSRGVVSRYKFVIDPGLTSGRFVEDTSDGTGVEGSGVFVQQNPGAFNLVAQTSSSFNGNFAFGLVGTDGTGQRKSVVGAFATDQNAVVVQGEGDLRSGSSVLSRGAMAGRLRGPVDAAGRCTAQLDVVGMSVTAHLELAVYILGTSRAYAIDVTPTATNAHVLAGSIAQILPKQAWGNNNFGYRSLTGLNVLSLWGAEPGSPSKPSVALGVLGVPIVGNPAVLYDENDAGTVATDQIADVAALNVDPSGRGTFDWSQTGQPPRQFVFYLSGPGEGYVQETNSPANHFGFLEHQSGTFSNATVRGTYQGGTSWPPVAGALNVAAPFGLTPAAMTAASGTFKLGAASGTYSFDSATGRGTAQASGAASFLGQQFVFYCVAPDRILCLGIDSGGAQGALLQLRQ